MNKNTVIYPSDGSTCPRCTHLMQVREHDTILPQQRRQPFYYERWYCCVNRECKTTTVMLDKHKIYNHNRRATFHKTLEQFHQFEEEAQQRIF